VEDPPASRRTFWIIAGAGALLYLLTAITNPGIIAADDYGDVISRVLPAQAHSVQEISEKAKFRSPFTPLTHFAIVKTAHALGVDHPLTQFRIDLVVAGLFSFFLTLWAGCTVFGAYAEPDRRRHQTVFAGLLGFYFLAPLLLTRPMVEAMSAPFLAASAALACRYQMTLKTRWLVLSILSLAIGAMHRPHIGVCALALVALVIWLRRWKDLAVLAGVGAACVIASGMLDYWLIGEWHGTLRRYVAYNLIPTAPGDRSSYFVFPLLFVGLSLPPAFFLRYRTLDWKARYDPLRPVVLFFVPFLVMHTLVRHKEERFMIPLLPLFLMLLTPLLAFLIAHRDRYRWRLAFLGVVNGVLLALAVTSAPQRATLELARYVDANPAITTISRVGDFILVPTVFVSHPVTARESKELDDAALGCNGVVAVLALTKTGEALAADPRLTRVAEFDPGPLERLLVAINPRHNARRGPVMVLRPVDCVNREPGTGNGEQ